MWRKEPPRRGTVKVIPDHLEPVLRNRERDADQGVSDAIAMGREVAVGAISRGLGRFAPERRRSDDGVEEQLVNRNRSQQRQFAGGKFSS